MSLSFDSGLRRWVLCLNSRVQHRSMGVYKVAQKVLLSYEYFSAVENIRSMRKQIRKIANLTLEQNFNKQTIVLV